MLFAQGLPPPSLDLLVEIKLMPHGGQDALFTQDSDDGDDDVGNPDSLNSSDESRPDISMASSQEIIQLSCL